ncbi:hypothetical protein Y1Q_0000164 [Alligator mississippiensis]|uniref:Uncharacterized protein n=1 Tax=Alligator mississippiensis TaxID=8496 RepID=A0A151MYJ0_ALLMI|nr:hypothetical protein Y1Q_0000164 [Alligator mississippiensis]
MLPGEYCHLMIIPEIFRVSGAKMCKHKGKELPFTNGVLKSSGKERSQAHLEHWISTTGSPGALLRCAFAERLTLIKRRKESVVVATVFVKLASASGLTLILSHSSNNSNSVTISQIFYFQVETTDLREVSPTTPSIQVLGTSNSGSLGYSGPEAAHGTVATLGSQVAGPGSLPSIARALWMHRLCQRSTQAHTILLD